jgi:hypothetical protein
MRDDRMSIVFLGSPADAVPPLRALVAAGYEVALVVTRPDRHLDRGEFSTHGYFPETRLAADPPRLLLVSPSLEFHSTTETLLSFFSPAIDVERIGLGVEWRKGLQVMFRLRGAARPR